MQVPIPDEGEGFHWETISSIKTEDYNGTVYSMNVADGHHYVADGIVVHNCWYAVKKGKTGHWSGDRTQSTLWQIDHRKSETGHRSQKPVECMKRPMENNASPGQAVYDPFAGSGTSIIAAEMTSRICHAIELNPQWCDVSAKRWSQFTGKPVIHEATGRTFDQLSAEREAK